MNLCNRWAMRQGTVPRAWAVCLAIAGLLLAGCGPGVGGTGTGAEPPLASFGASPASLCSSSLSTAVACSSSGSILAPGVGAVATADRWSAEGVRLVITGNRAELTLGCPIQRFNGDWGTVGGAPPRYYGELSTASGSVLAQLEMTAENGSLRLRLLDAQGQLLQGPWLLLPSSSSGAPLAC